MGFTTLKQTQHVETNVCVILTNSYLNTTLNSPKEK